MKKSNGRAQWSSKIGFILAAVGSAVGLGNIWKFPGKAYDGGGGAFILIYVAIVLLIGMPVMLSELALGRNTQSDTVGTFRKLNKKFTWVGYIGVIVAFIIVCYYSHIGGWVLRYIAGYIIEPNKIFADPKAYCYNMLGYSIADGSSFIPWTAIIFAAIFIAANAIIIIKGVEGGIEKFNKVGMPALFAILIILLVRVITMDGTGEGLRYMMTVDFSNVTFDTLLTALGQAFYSLSLGMAIMTTYGSYVPKSENLAKNTALICIMDTIVALVSGFIVVPAVFATVGSESVGKGALFAFVSLAGVFEQMPGGAFFGMMFYLLLFFAALSSCISIIEGVVAFLTEQFGCKRKSITIWLCIAMLVIGSVYTSTQAAFGIKGIWFDFKNGVTYPAFCDFMEFITDRVMIPLCALGITVFVGWFWKPQSAVAEVESSGVKFKLAGVYGFLIKYVVPVSITVILAVSIITGTTLS